MWELAVAAAGSLASQFYSWGQNRKAIRRQMTAMRKQAQGDEKQYLEEAAIAKQNELISLVNIYKLDKQQGLVLQESLDRASKVKALQESEFAVSGFDLGSGTFNTIRENTIKENSFEALAIRETFKNSKWEFTMQANNFRSQAERLLNAASSIDWQNYNPDYSTANASLITGLANIGADMANTMYSASAKETPKKNK